MKDKDYINMTGILFSLSLALMFFHLILTFPSYFAGFFFGLLFYSFIDAYTKKDL